ncbi:MULTISPECIES: O-antigen ligase family protein [unclassified Mesorhizobium]|uniref:O-antigen ligase family protein n=1 Tax=unclassified Mesorhizobium TaxID=325217 RepID=UPI001FE2172B|nr:MULTISPECIES: O-antigen ligase family protein [unclassified Mesorhizobium]
MVDPAFGRAEFARTTIAGIEENWATGVGFGSFPKVYQIYEKGEMIFKPYVNHAHNDYLELALEAGAPVVFLVAAYSILLFAFSLAARRDRLQKWRFSQYRFCSFIPWSIIPCERRRLR